MERFETRKFCIAFCLVFIVAALVIGLMLTKEGAIFSPDSVNYQVAAENLHNHHIFGMGPYGIFKHNPAYPMMIAALMYVCSPEQAAKVIVVLSFALLMIPIFLIGKKISGVLTGCVACLMCLIMTPLLVITNYAWTDMPALFFSMMGVLFLVYYASNPKIITLIIAALFIAWAVLVRFAGTALVATGCMVIVLANIQQIKIWSRKWIGVTVRLDIPDVLRKVALFGVIAMLPVFLYLCRCYVYTGYFSEEASRSRGEGIKEIVGWIFSMGFSHLFTDSSLRIFIIVPVVILLAVALSLQKKWVWLKDNYVVVLYAVVYVSILAVNGIVFLMFHQANYLCPMYPLIILATVSLIVWVCRHKPALFALAVIPLLLFMAIQFDKSASYYRLDRNNIGNMNSEYWRNEQGIQWLSGTDATIYTNDMPIIWFIMDKPAFFLPRNNPVEIEEFFEGWQPNSYIICFKEDNAWARLTNEQIAELDAFWVVVDYPTSTIWAAK